MVFSQSQFIFVYFVVGAEASEIWMEQTKL